MGTKRCHLNAFGALLFSFCFLAAPSALSQKAPQEDLHLGVKVLLKGHWDIARLGLQKIESPHLATSKRLEIKLIQLFAEEGIEVLTPEKVKQQLAQAQTSGQSANANNLWADHLLLGNATTAGDKLLVSLWLIKVSTGETVSQTEAFAGDSAKDSSIAAATMRGAVERIADDLHYEISQLPGDTRYQRVAVMPLEENGNAARNLALGKYFQQEIGMALRERGFLSVERSRLNEAITQIGLAQALSAENAPATGKMIGAQVLVVGSVSEAGEKFIITGRALDASTGALLGSSQISAKRDNIVTLASGAIETRSVGGALFRSMLAPGWGHFYFLKPIRGMMWTVATYGTVAIALGAAGAAYQQQQAYTSFTPQEGEANTDIQQELAERRTQANNLYTASAVAGGMAALLWSSNVIDAVLVANDSE